MTNGVHCRVFKHQSAFALREPVNISPWRTFVWGAHFLPRGILQFPACGLLTSWRLGPIIQYAHFCLILLAPFSTSSSQMHCVSHVPFCSPYSSIYTTNEPPFSLVEGTFAEGGRKNEKGFYLCPCSHMQPHTLPYICKAKPGCDSGGGWGESTDFLLDFSLWCTQVKTSSNLSIDYHSSICFLSSKRVLKVCLPLSSLLFLLFL